MSKTTCKSYIKNIVFSQNSIAACLQQVKWKDYSKTLILVDTKTKKHCLPLVIPFIDKKSLVSILSIPYGEKEKNIETCQKIWKTMTYETFDRKSLLINLGGGVIGDMGGFCAASYKRGIDFINIPTTLLAQVDASVGGKLGIDFLGYKNHIGLFKNPKTVFIDAIFLKTLPFEEIRSGFAEIIKHCLIKDKTAFDTLQKESFPTINFIHWIKHSVSIKSSIILKDPYEQGLRKILNFGHTVGHAVETYFLNKKKPILHGEAVALGMVCEAFLSHKINGLPSEEVKKIYDYIFSIYPQKRINKSEIDAIAQITYQDKKNSNGNIEIVMLDKIGQAKEGYQILFEHIVESLHFYADYSIVS